MTKQILMSIQPQHLCNILNGTKTLELRKTVPNGFVGWVNLYCTKPKKRWRVGCMSFFSDELFKTSKGEIKYGSSVELMADDNYNKDNFLNGKVVARFWWKGDIEKLKLGRWVNHKVGDWNYRGYMDEHLETFKKACLTEEEINNYGNGKDLYAIPITKLEVFDKPKEVGEFYTYKKKTIYSGMDCPPYVDEIKVALTKACQSWQYVWVK